MFGNALNSKKKIKIGRSKSLFSPRKCRNSFWSEGGDRAPAGLWKKNQGVVKKFF